MANMENYQEYMVRGKEPTKKELLKGALERFYWKESRKNDSDEYNSYLNNCVKTNLVSILDKYLCEPDGGKNPNEKEYINTISSDVVSAIIDTRIGFITQLKTQNYSTDIEKITNNITKSWNQTMEIVINNMSKSILSKIILEHNNILDKNSHDNLHKDIHSYLHYTLKIGISTDLLHKYSMVVLSAV